MKGNLKKVLNKVMIFVIVLTMSIGTLSVTAAAATEGKSAQFTYRCDKESYAPGDTVVVDVIMTITGDYRGHQCFLDFAKAPGLKLVSAEVPDETKGALNALAMDCDTESVRGIGNVVNGLNGDSFVVGRFTFKIGDDVTEDQVLGFDQYSFADGVEDKLDVSTVASTVKVNLA